MATEQWHIFEAKSKYLGLRGGVRYDARRFLVE
jgi:hypothetical protein